VFERLEKPSYPQLVAQRVRSLIVDRQLGPGDRLPSERAMAEQFGVSRSSIREGIKLLDALGWVEIRIGDGIYVSNDLSQSVMQSLSWAIILSESVAAELIEARTVLEPHLAALAAQRADDKHRAAIYETIDRMEREIGNVERVVEADMDFHLAVARAAQNNLLFQTLSGLQQIMRAHLKDFYIGESEQRHALADHRAVYEAIARGDADEASAAMAAGILKPQDLATIDLNRSHRIEGNL
jgi:GntR family transcriptional repressor for pyruvate dehydrogenase complex